MSKPIKPLIPAGTAAGRVVANGAWSGQPVLTVRKSANVTSSSASSNSSITDGTSLEKPKRKRQRLDHLTQEEKIMRRKLKNRMAAQSARDRKKVKMQDLEGEVNRVADENQMLTKRNAFLEKRVRALEAENGLLRKKLGMVPATGNVADQMATSSTSVEESFLKLMAGLQDGGVDDGDQFYDEDQDDDQWSDAEDVDGVMFDDVHMMAQSSLIEEDEDEDFSRDGSQSDLSDDSGLLSFVGQHTPTASSSSPARSSISSVSSGGCSAVSAPLGGAIAAVDESLESAEGSGLVLGGGVPSGVVGRGNAGHRVRAGVAKTTERRGGRRVVPVSQPTSGSFHGDHLNFLTSSTASFPVGGTSVESIESELLSSFAPLVDQVQQSSPSDLIAPAVDVLADPTAFDELFNSICQSYDQQPAGERAVTSAEAMLATNEQQLPSQIGAPSVEETVQQLFASLDPECGLELAAGNRRSQGVHSSTGPTSAARSVSPMMASTSSSSSQHVDHDYVARRSTDVNNNRLDLLDSLLGSASSIAGHHQNKLQFPLSPLSDAHSTDFGYESAGSPASITSISNTKNTVANQNSFEGSFDDDFLMGDLSLGSFMQPSVLDDPMMLDPTLMELFPEMF